MGPNAGCGLCGAWRAPWRLPAALQSPQGASSGPSRALKPRQEARRAPVRPLGALERLRLPADLSERLGDEEAQPTAGGVEPVRRQGEGDGRPRPGRCPCATAWAPRATRPPRSPPPCLRRPGFRSRRAARDRRAGCRSCRQGRAGPKGMCEGSAPYGGSTCRHLFRARRGGCPAGGSTPPLRLLLRAGHREANFAALPCAGGPLPARARARPRAHVREVRFCHRTRSRVQRRAIRNPARPRRPPLRAPLAHAAPPSVGLGRCAAADGATP